jgi:hypothetical protein
VIALLGCCSSSDPSVALRQQQEQQQQKVMSGTTQINKVFGGGTYGINPATSYDPSKAYYTMSGDPFKFDPAGSDYQSFINAHNLVWSDKQNPGAGQSAYIQDLIDKGNLYTGTETSPGFGQDFYNKRRDAFEAYSLPFLSREFQQTGNNLKYKLANQGLLGSSVGGTLGNSLSRELGIQKENVANQALTQAQGLQQQIAQAKNADINQLIAGGDPGQALNSARETATQFGAPSPLPAVGSFFQNWINQNLAQGVGQAYQPAFQQSGLTTSQFLNPFKAFSTSTGNGSYNVR